MAQDTPRAPTVYRADCYFGEDEWRRVLVDARFTCFCDRNFASGKTYCARGNTVYAEPLDATVPLKNKVQGKIVVINRGGNPLFQKAQHAVNAGAVGVIFVNTDDNEPPAFIAEEGQHIKIPCVAVKQSWLTTPGARIGDECTITVATMGPTGTVDFQTLVQGFQNAKKEFDDHAFPATLNSIFLDYRTPLPGYTSANEALEITWKRPRELLQSQNGELQEPKLWVDGAVPNDIIQGQMGDCYFLAAAATLCPENIKQIFVEQRYFDQGFLAIKFFKNGKWLDVAIDTRIPCRDNKPQFVTRPDVNEFWIIMLEKAYAKLHGTYEMLDAGMMEDAMEDMTGSPPGRVNVAELFSAARRQDGGLDKDKAMKLLQGREPGRRLQGASCDGGTEEKLNDGLYAGHAYSIHTVKKTTTGEVLVRLRNPWGCYEWTGAWSDNDQRNWTPELQKEMGFTKTNDGTFFMSISDFIRVFNKITYVDLVPEGFFVHREKGSWKGKSAGGCVNNQKTWGNNPQFRMTIATDTDITITLSQPDGKMAAAPSRLLHEGYKESIAVEFFKEGNCITGWNKEAERRLLKETVYQYQRSVSLDLGVLGPGDYVVMVSTFDPGVEMDFYMSFYCSKKIKVEKIARMHTASLRQRTIAAPTVDVTVDMADRRTVGDLLGAVFQEADLLDGYTDPLQSKEVDRVFTGKENKQPQKGCVRMALWLYLEHIPEIEDLEEEIKAIPTKGSGGQADAMQSFVKKIIGKQKKPKTSKENKTEEPEKEFISFCVDLDAAASAAMLQEDQKLPAWPCKACVALCHVDVPAETTFQELHPAEVPDAFVVEGVLARGLDKGKYKITGENIVCANYNTKWVDRSKAYLENAKTHAYRFIGSTQVYLNRDWWDSHVTVKEYVIVHREYTDFGITR